MPDRMPQRLSKYMPERISVCIYICIHIVINIPDIYNAVCQKLCQNSVSGQGSLKEIKFPKGNTWKTTMWRIHKEDALLVIVPH